MEGECRTLESMVRAILSLIGSLYELVYELKIWK